MIERERELSQMMKLICIKEQLYELIFKFQQETVYPEDIDQRALAILQICSSKKETVSGKTADTKETSEGEFTSYSPGTPELHEY